MPAKNEGATVPPIQKIMEVAWAYAPARTFLTGVELQVFTHLANGARTAADVAAAAHADPRGMRFLLDGLVGLDFLEKRGAEYFNGPAAEQHLVKSALGYVGHMYEDNSLWDSWANLTESVRTGKPLRAVESKSVAEDFFVRLVRSLHVSNAPLANRAAQVLRPDENGAANVLDVACGSGIWGIALAKLNPETSVVYQDYPKVLEQTREYVEREGVADQAEYLAGALAEVEFGVDEYDIAILGNIIHSEGEAASRSLLKKLHPAMRKGGRVCIVEIVPNAERSGPPQALMFAINMLVNTEKGDTYTFGEMESWLHEAGFSNVTTADIGSMYPMTIARA